MGGSLEPGVQNHPGQYRETLPQLKKKKCLNGFKKLLLRRYVLWSDNRKGKYTESDIFCEKIQVKG